MITMNAYSDLYVDDAMTNLGEMLYAGARLLNLNVESLFRDFSYSDIGMNFSKGNPRYIVGMSGFELLERLIFDTQKKKVNLHYPNDTGFRLTDEYNAGYAMGYYQWKSGESFKILYKRGLTVDMAISALSGSDADLERFADAIDIVIERNVGKKASSLARLRAYWNLSQRELSKRSGVSLRSIQLYEQGQNDISRASADTVYRLSKVLGCNMEELLL